MPWPTQIGVVASLIAAIISLVIWFTRSLRADWLATIDAANKRADAAIVAAEKREELWRQAYLAAEERGRVRDAQVNELLDMSRTTSEVLRALQQVATTGPPRSG